MSERFENGWENGWEGIWKNGSWWTPRFAYVLNQILILPRRTVWGTTWDFRLVPINRAQIKVISWQKDDYGVGQKLIWWSHLYIHDHFGVFVLFVVQYKLYFSYAIIASEHDHRERMPFSQGNAFHSWGNTFFLWGNAYFSRGNANFAREPTTFLRERIFASAKYLSTLIFYF